MLNGMRTVLLLLFSAALLSLPSFASRAYATAGHTISKVPGFYLTARSVERGRPVRRYDTRADLPVVELRVRVVFPSSLKTYKKGGGSEGGDGTPQEHVPLIPAAPVDLPRPTLSPSVSRRGPPQGLVRLRAASTPSSPRAPPSVLP